MGIEPVLVRQIDEQRLAEVDLCCRVEDGVEVVPRLLRIDERLDSQDGERDGNNDRHCRHDPGDDPCGPKQSQSAPRWRRLGQHVRDGDRGDPHQERRAGSDTLSDQEPVAGSGGGQHRQSEGHHHRPASPESDPSNRHVAEAGHHLARNEPRRQHGHGQGHGPDEIEQPLQWFRAKEIGAVCDISRADADPRVGAMRQADDDQEQGDQGSPQGKGQQPGDLASLRHGLLLDGTVRQGRTLSHATSNRGNRSTLLDGLLGGVGEASPRGGGGRVAQVIALPCRNSSPHRSGNPAGAPTCRDTPSCVPW
jgi:hypothetical protein